MLLKILFLSLSLAMAEGPLPAPIPAPAPAPETILPQVDADDSGEDSEDSPLLPDEADKKDLASSKRTHWTAPDFSNQTGALGWDAHVFSSPPGFQRRVQFWIDIYTKYSTHQALLHDARFFDIVYKVLDFSDIEKALPHG